MGDYYDMNGNPISMMDWANLMASDPDERRVARDVIGGVTVSTVWLGLDHNYGDGPPHIFETKIFGGDHDQYTARYSTREQALAGHAEAVALVTGARVA